MIIIKKIKINNFRNIKEAVLDNCGDFNIIIGPPNCGKTNILHAIDILTKLRWDETSSFCNYGYIREINLILNDNFKIAPLRCDGINERDSYFKKEAFKINLEFDEEFVEHLLFQTKKTTPKKVLEALEFLPKYLEFLNEPEYIGKSKILLTFEEELNKQNVRKIFATSLPMLKIDSQTFEKITKFISTIKNSMYEISLVQDAFSKRYALPDSLSLLYIKEVFNYIKVLLIEDNRIKEYKTKTLREYIKDKNMPSGEVAELIKLIKEIGDSSLTDLTTATFDFKKEIENEEFQTPIEEQGSGIRSLICPLGDIISLKDPSIILFDEPEIGLNPLAKQKLLDFLLQQSRYHQIFITTHDPTFVNPLFWKDKNIRISIYLYSPYEEKFVKINTQESEEDPNTFAGYLSHTHSLKDIHIYVEGSSDVYIFQVFLNKYIDNIKEFENKKYEILNKVGIYHLGGNNWLHLLYTIPKHPYKCLVILDGDKKEEVKKVIEKYNQNLVNIPRFEFCETWEKVIKALSSEWPSLPIYCLEKNRIEDYLFPEGLPPNFNKKIDGPLRAEVLENIPEEIEKLLKIIFGQITISESQDASFYSTIIIETCSNKKIENNNKK
ncbi:MAG: ATP-binding protein [Candidatus Aenigmatarchaeota archaeon]